MRNDRLGKPFAYDDNGEPMFRCSWTDWAGFGLVALVGVACWIYAIAWFLS